MTQEFDLLYHTGCSWFDVERMAVGDRRWLHDKLRKQKEKEDREMRGGKDQTPEGFVG